MPSEEVELIRRCQIQDEAAFAELYQQHVQFAYGTALILVRNPNIAADVCQEAFLRAFKNINRFREGESFRAWFYRIVVNEAMRLTRRMKRWPIPTDKIPNSLSPSAHNPEFVALSKEQGIEIWELVQRLPVKLRVPLVLRYYSDLSEEEIANTLHIALGTVKSRLNRAREGLRKDFPVAMKLLRGDNHA
ncbi:sigma-70 family RNA polymerase sigma factor [Desulfosporosinus sp. PR]|uniref:RNA polymerase sigma factor n=1 Tax=Candidatus Desulfosporosinus nitrosoreducens TaxID=3401928 RepID=UPI0027F932CA|nr:sigma-70 family RNA polymerase sigma factor [Desulfosporosinus sp. PR]MDQ7097017.1 sigma-70 family RNA polymerase sigma factor [Desulfosporosinus sp. PR]